MMKFATRAPATKSPLLLRASASPAPVARRVTPDARRQNITMRRRIMFTWLAIGIAGALVAARRPGDPQARFVRGTTALFLGPLYFAALAAGARVA